MIGWVWVKNNLAKGLLTAKLKLASHKMCKRLTASRESLALAQVIFSGDEGWVIIKGLRGEKRARKEA